MPIHLRAGAPTLIVRRQAYEAAGLVRAAVDERLGLADDEFAVEGELVAIGPIQDADAFAAFVEDLEKLGLVYYDDFFELSGNWPAWLGVLASGAASGRSRPSHPQQ